MMGILAPTLDTALQDDDTTFTDTPGPGLFLRQMPRRASNLIAVPAFAVYSETEEKPLLRSPSGLPKLPERDFNTLIRD